MRRSRDFLRAAHRGRALTQSTSVLTDNGIQFTSTANIGSAAADIRRAIDRGEHLPGACFRIRMCPEATSTTGSPNHDTRGPTARSRRMNRTIKEATVKRFHYDDPQPTPAGISADFVSAYNFGRRLKTLKGLTPFEYNLQNLDNRTGSDSHSTRLHQMPGLNNQAAL